MHDISSELKTARRVQKLSIILLVMLGISYAVVRLIGTELNEWQVACFTLSSLINVVMFAIATVVRPQLVDELRAERWRVDKNTKSKRE